MSWDGAVDRIPHVFDAIFSQLKSGRDMLAASEVCSQWERAIAKSSLLNTNYALNILRDTGSQRQQIINIDDVLTRQRRYSGVIVSPTGEAHFNWNDLFDALGQLNEKSPIEWARIDGSRHRPTIRPESLIRFGAVLNNLQELEVHMDQSTIFYQGWLEAFRNFIHLKEVTLHKAHGLVLDSLQIHCGQLRKLVVKHIALHQPLAEFLNFPLLEELSMEEIDFYGCLEGSEVKSINMPCLKYLNITFNPHIPTTFIHLSFSKIVAPMLRSISATSNLGDFLRVTSGEWLQSIRLNLGPDPNRYTDPEPSKGAITIEVDNMSNSEIVSWINMQYPSAEQLIFDFCPKEALEALREDAVRRLPDLREITVGETVYWQREDD